MTTTLPYVLTISTVVLIATGQILFKMVAQRIAGRSVVEGLVDATVLFPFVLALGIYGLATLLWILALRDLPLARAYFLMSLSFVIVPAISALVFSERLTMGFALGGALIMAGVIVTQMWS
jgi:undecaprenyl phosphate-alpha-L-ara4N flippase subunit ArnF